MPYFASLVLLAHLAPDILLFMFSKLWTCAILDFEVRMIPKLKNNNFCLFVRLNLKEKDPLFVLLAHQALEIYSKKAKKLILSKISR